MGREAQDVKCTDDEDRNLNIVKYYKNKFEMYNDLQEKASQSKMERMRLRREAEESLGIHVISPS